MKTRFKKWFKAAGIRAFRTFCQTLLSTMTVVVGVTRFCDIDWITSLSISILAAIYSLLMSCVTDLPEIPEDEDDLK